jgi:hypothetical protein
MITFELLTKDNMTEHSLDDFDRTQQVHQVYRKINQEYELVKEVWIMDWSLGRKRNVAKTIEFYKSMGCVITDNPIMEFTKEEPYDLQMVCAVD